MSGSREHDRAVGGYTLCDSGGCMTHGAEAALPTIATIMEMR